METVGKTEIWSFVAGRKNALPTDNTAVRKNAGHRVRNYLELASKVAELQFRNQGYVLLFRGQNRNFVNRQGNTALKPSLFRPVTSRSDNPPASALEQRFALLERAERELVRRYAGTSLLGRERLERHRILRWAVLQHYETCRTPLLDVSQSLRISASFASHGATAECYLYVLAVPNISGAVTASAEAGVQTVRLSSVCPPTALRPHIQEGYLIGQYPELVDFAQKQHYHYHEIDLARRLIAKFRFDPKKFWGAEVFPIVPDRALYPNSGDDLFNLMSDVKTAIGTCA